MTSPYPLSATSKATPASNLSPLHPHWSYNDISIIHTSVQSILDTVMPFSVLSAWNLELGHPYNTPSSSTMIYILTAEPLLCHR